MKRACWSECKGTHTTYVEQWRCEVAPDPFRSGGYTARIYIADDGTKLSALVEYLRADTLHAAKLLATKWCRDTSDDRYYAERTAEYDVEVRTRPTPNSGWRKGKGAALTARKRGTYRVRARSPRHAARLALQTVFGGNASDLSKSRDPWARRFKGMHATRNGVLTAKVTAAAEEAAHV